MPVMFFYLVVDSTKCVTLNILRSTGRPQITVYGNLVSCLAIMLPLGWFLSMDMSYGNVHHKFVFLFYIIIQSTTSTLPFTANSSISLQSIYLWQFYITSKEIFSLISDFSCRITRTLVCDVHCLVDFHSCLPSSCVENRLGGSDCGES